MDGVTWTKPKISDETITAPIRPRRVSPKRAAENDAAEQALFERAHKQAEHDDQRQLQGPVGHHPLVFHCGAEQNEHAHDQRYDQRVDRLLEREADAFGVGHDDVASCRDGHDGEHDDGQSQANEHHVRQRPVGWHEPDHGQSDGEPDGGYEQRMGSCKRAYRRHAVPLSLAGSK